MKQISDNSHDPFHLLFITIVSFLFLSLIAGIIASVIASGYSVPLSETPLPKLAPDQRQGLRLLLLTNNLLPFAATGAVALFIIYRKNLFSAAGLHRPVYPFMLAPAVGLFVLSIPMVVFFSWLNLQVPLPDWAIADEERTNALLAEVLTMESPTEFITTLITVAVTPAIGEELLMRGVLQQRIFGAFFSNQHLSIWLAAVVFSAGHMEFAGFLPRLLLGAALGYTLYWTGSLWVPVVLHFLFNGLQIVNAYRTGDFQPDTQLDFTPPWWLGVGASVIFCVILAYGERKRKMLQSTNTGEAPRV